MNDEPLVAGVPAPLLSGSLAGRGSFDLAGWRGRPVLIEFHRGTW